MTTPDADRNGTSPSHDGQPAAGHLPDGYRGWLDPLRGMEIGDGLDTREGQLDRLLTVTGEVVGGELQPDIALRRLSEAAERFIKHHVVDIGWVEDGKSYC